MADATPQPQPRRRLPSLRPVSTGLRLEMLEAAMRQVAEGVVIVDRKGRFVFWNEAAQRIVGTGPLSGPPSEWSSAYGCFLPDKVTPYPPDQLPLARAMRGEHVSEAEMFIRNPNNLDGAWISINSAPLRDEKGEPAGGVIVFRDVTAHRRSNEVVRQLSMAVEKTTDAVFITDPNAVIEYVNPAFEATTGYTQEQAVGQRASLLKSGRNRAGLLRAAVEEHPGRRRPQRHPRQSKEERRAVPHRADHHAGERRGGPHHPLRLGDARRHRAQEGPGARGRDAPRPDRATEALPGPGAGDRGLRLWRGAAFPADHTCGDYYDFVPFPDGRVGIAVGDVSGHGFGPALLMAETRAYLRSLSKTSVDLGQILRRLNRFLCEDTEDERFVTLMLTLLDPVRRASCTRARGTSTGYVLDRSGATRHVLGSTGTPLGIFGEADFAVQPRDTARGGGPAVVADRRRRGGSGPGRRLLRDRARSPRGRGGAAPQRRGDRGQPADSDRNVLPGQPPGGRHHGGRVQGQLTRGTATGLSPSSSAPAGRAWRRP